MKDSDSVTLTAWLSPACNQLSECLERLICMPIHQPCLRRVEGVGLLA